MLPPLEQMLPDEPDWQALCHQLQATSHLSVIVLLAWQMGQCLAHAIVEKHLHHLSALPTRWPNCPTCGHPLESKGLVHRCLVTLVGPVEWHRRVGRCPQRCRGSTIAPLDAELGIAPYQQVSKEVLRLGCLLSVFLPFELSAQLLAQLTGITLSAQTLWKGVQKMGQQAIEQVEQHLTQLAQGHQPSPEPLSDVIAQMTLALAADGVMVPFRPQLSSPKGKIVWREVKVALLTRLGEHITRNGKRMTRLYHRRLVSVLGNLEDLQQRLTFEALRQNIDQAPKVIWLSDGARGFWRVFEESFAHCAIGILDFYHAAQHLWQAAEAYHDGNPARTPQMWFERMRRQLRRGFGHQVISELDWLSKRKSTSQETKPILRRVRDYLECHRNHIQYRQFKKQGLPIGSGMIESACKWLIQQRFKGVGMRWSEPGFNHLLHLRLAWVNQRFEHLFSQENLDLTSYSPKL